MAYLVLPVLRAVSCSRHLSHQDRLVSPQYTLLVPFSRQVLQVIEYVTLCFRQLPGLLLQGLQPGLEHTSFLHGAWFPMVLIRVFPSFSTTFTLPDLNPLITFSSIFWMDFLSSPLGVWVTKITDSGLAVRQPGLVFPWLFSGLSSVPGFFLNHVDLAVIFLASLP